MNITEFLEARIAEDEAVARAASPGPWKWVGDTADDTASLYSGDALVISAYGNHTEGYLECGDADRAYIACHNPARVLTECAAKRAIIHLHRAAQWFSVPHGCVTCRVRAVPVEFPCQTVRVLAAVYADHPDYDPAWVPEK